MIITLLQAMPLKAWITVSQSADEKISVRITIGFLKSLAPACGVMVMANRWCIIQDGQHPDLYRAYPNNTGLEVNCPARKLTSSIFPPRLFLRSMITPSQLDL